MSLLPTTSHRDPTTPFWAYSGGGGGGAVSSVNAGTGISVDTTTGNVTVTNDGVTSITAGPGISVDTTTGNVTVSNTEIVNANIGLYPTTGSVPLGIDKGDTVLLGTIDTTKFIVNKDHFYTAGITLLVTNVVFSNSSYDGNMHLLLSYDDGTGNIAGIGAQSVYISHTSNDDTVSQYCFSLTLGFKEQTGYSLQVRLSNETTEKINSFNYGISNFYTLDTGTVGNTGEAIFV